MKIKESAFKDKNGKVVGTGSFHDVNQLPTDFQVEQEGYLTDEGNFVTRDEAKEQKLAKSQQFQGFPGLGVEQRPETPIIQPHDVAYRNEFLINAAKLKHPGMTGEEKNKLKEMTNAGVSQGHKVSGRSVAGGSPITSSYAVSSPDVTGTQIHENMHLMFNQVHRKHGQSARRDLAYNLYNTLRPEHKEAIQKWMKHNIGTKGFNQLSASPHFWEEGLAHLLSYLNKPGQRRSFHETVPGHAQQNPLTRESVKDDKGNIALTDEGKSFDRTMKDAFYRIKNLAPKVDKTWTQRRFKPGEAPFAKSEWEPTEEDFQLAKEMAKTFDHSAPEFKAASFMAHGFQPSPEEIDEALKECEGDLPLAALMAHKLDVNDANLALLHSIIKMNDFKKTELDVAAIPRTVKPFDEESKYVANAAQQAFTDHRIYSVKLNGKHSAGTALFKDPETDTIWLLKPGSGNLSRALGMSEETASQSRREVAFNRIAKLMGLGAYVPHCALLLIDGQEVAALEFFSDGFKTVGKLTKKSDANLETFFNNLNKNGLLFKIAALDYLLGSVDRHSNNMMLNAGHELKLIDAGSTFAGNSFNPAKDPKSFIPFYLRAFSPRNFKVLTPQERLKLMPYLDEQSEQALQYWLGTLPTGQIVQEMNKLGINPEPFINRLHTIQDFAGKKSEFLRAFFAGAM